MFSKVIEATAVSPGRYGMVLPTGWATHKKQGTNKGIHGGLLASVLLGAMRREIQSSYPTSYPLDLSVTYLAPAVPGPAEIDVQVEVTNQTLVQARAMLAPFVRASATFSQRDTPQMPEMQETGEGPSMVPVDTSNVVWPEFLSHFHLEFSPNGPLQWLRLAEPEPYTHELLAAMLDVPPPIPLIQSGGTARVSTASLFVQFARSDYSSIDPTKPVQTTSGVQLYTGTTGTRFVSQQNQLHSWSGAVLASCMQTYVVREAS